MKIRKDSIFYFIIIILLFQVMFVRLPYLSNYTNIKRVILIFLSLFLLLNFKSFMKKIPKGRFLLFSYLLFVLISGFINRNLHDITHTLISSLTYIGAILVFYFATILISRKKDFNFILKSLFYISLFYIVLNDIFIIIDKNILKNYYLIGDKFDVAYMHLLCISFFMFLNSEKKQSFIDIIVRISLLIITFFILGTIDCSTGIVGLMVFVGLFCLYKKSNYINKKLYCISLILSAFFVFFVNNLLQIGIIQNFIVNFLERDLTLTGRMTIYENVPNILENHLLFGYGHGSSYETWMKYIFYPNSQNGIIDCIVEQGIIATILLIVNAIYIVMKQSNKSKVFSLYVLLITFNVLSTVEITLNLTYVSILLLMNLYCESKEDCLDKS